MTQQIINNLESGLVVRGKLNDNFSELYAALAGGATIRTITGTSHTLELADANAILLFTSNSAITLTVPNNTVAIPTSSFVECHQRGTGAITVVAGSGATLRSRGSLVQSAGQFAIFGLRKTASAEWALTGDLV